MLVLRDVLQMSSRYFAQLDYSNAFAPLSTQRLTASLPNNTLLMSTRASMQASTRGAVLRCRPCICCV